MISDFAAWTQLPLLSLSHLQKVIKTYSSYFWFSFIISILFYWIQNPHCFWQPSSMLAKYPTQSFICRLVFSLCKFGFPCLWSLSCLLFCISLFPSDLLISQQGQDVTVDISVDTLVPPPVCSTTPSLKQAQWACQSHDVQFTFMLHQDWRLNTELEKIWYKEYLHGSSGNEITQSSRNTSQSEERRVCTAGD